MEFRIVSGDPTGFFGVSDRLTAHKAVSLFLSMIHSTFPGVLDDPVMTEVALTDWCAKPTPHIIVMGDGDWKLALAPAFADDRVPTAN